MTPLEDISRFKSDWVKEYGRRREVGGSDIVLTDEIYVSKGVYRRPPSHPSAALLIYSQFSKQSLPLSTSVSASISAAAPITNAPSSSDMTTSMLALSLKWVIQYNCKTVFLSHQKLILKRAFSF